MPGEGIEGDEWGAYVTLDTYDRDERGITHRPRGIGGDRAPVVVAGVTTGQGGRESRLQGEGAQVIVDTRCREVCESAERRGGAGCPA